MARSEGLSVWKRQGERPENRQHPSKGLFRVSKGTDLIRPSQWIRLEQAPGWSKLQPYRTGVGSSVGRELARAADIRTTGLSAITLDADRAGWNRSPHRLRGWRDRFHAVPSRDATHLRIPWLMV